MSIDALTLKKLFDIEIELYSQDIKLYDSFIDLILNLNKTALEGQMLKNLDGSLLNYWHSLTSSILHRSHISKALSTLDEYQYAHSLELKIAEVKHGLKNSTPCQADGEAHIDYLFKLIDYVYGLILTRHKQGSGDLIQMLIEAGFLITKLSLLKGYDIEGYLEVLATCMEQMSDEKRCRLVQTAFENYSLTSNKY
jgi:hypothetical protein